MNPVLSNNIPIIVYDLDTQNLKSIPRGAFNKKLHRMPVKGESGYVGTPEDERQTLKDELRREIMLEKIKEEEKMEIKSVEVPVTKEEAELITAPKSEAEELKDLLNRYETRYQKKPVGRWSRDIGWLKGKLDDERGEE